MLVVLFRTLHKIQGSNILELCTAYVTALLLVPIVNNYVDSINRKYHVTMAMSPPTVNMEHTWDVFNELRKVKKCS